MFATNFSEFRKGLKKYLDQVEENNETLIIKRRAGKGVVITLAEYNSIRETVHLLRSKANRDYLYDSIQQMKEGGIDIKKLK